MAIATYVAYKTSKLKVLLIEDIKLNHNAKLHLEVLHVDKPLKFSPAAGIDRLADGALPSIFKPDPALQSQTCILIQACPVHVLFYVKTYSTFFYYKVIEV